MAEAALKQEERPAPRIIKISSKRQLTIPADMHERSGFEDYAFVSWKEDGSLILSPIDVRNEDTSVTILRSLLAQGYDGERLVDEYERIISPIIDYRCAVEQGLKDAREGRIASFDEMQQRLRGKYGI